MIIRIQDKERIIHILSRELTVPAQVLAYGSRVDGTGHETSDLDLAIKYANGEIIPVHVLSRLKDALSDSQIPIMIDLHDFHRLPSSFQERILSNKELLFEKK